MKRLYIFSLICLLSLSSLSAASLKWQTHFAYNNVEQIALYGDQAYALANGKLFSIHQVSEQMTLYTNSSGMHGQEVVQIMTDTARNQLLILYNDGKVDVLRNGSMHYISDLYSKKMTASKRCNNVTIHGSMAYLSMDFGILTFDLDRYEFVDSYYIGAEAAEVKVLDVLLKGDSIYAKVEGGVYAAHLEDNIVDYRYWHFLQSSDLPFDTAKGKHYTNARGDSWRASGYQGVTCTFATGVEHAYLPKGPYVNLPYHLHCAKGRLYMVPGGRWAVQESNPGHVMVYDNGDWVNITNDYIQAKTGKKALDFMNIAVDPADNEHFFVTSYGTGLYEFRYDSLYYHHTSHNSILSSAAPNYPDAYTRLDNAVYDAEGILWVHVAGDVDSTLVAFLPDGTTRGLNIHPDNQRLLNHTPGGLILDRHHPQRKWMLSCRHQPAVILLDDAGTTFDMSDDRCKTQTEFYDQDGRVIAPEFYYTMAQAPNGDIYLGSTIGPLILPAHTDFFETTHCRRLRITMPDGSNFLDAERINAFAWDEDGYVWIATHTAGVYVVDAEHDEIIAHYMSDNTEMPSNTVLSLAYDELSSTMYVGTSMGLVSVQLNSGYNTSTEDDEDEALSYGNMYQWRSHAAFTSMDQLAIVDDDVYTRSGYSLFSVDTEIGLIDYHTRLTGLNGSRIDHIAANDALRRLLITYQDGQLDILDERGDVQNISDLYLKQMSASKEVNDIYMHQHKAYLAMKFGILVLDMQKQQIEDTYYIGLNSSEVNVEYITILGDKIYAATQTGIYVASLSDNLVDYNYWTKQPLPGTNDLQGMRAHLQQLYVLRGGQLFVWQTNQWVPCPADIQGRRLCKTPNHLFVLPDNLYGAAQVLDNRVEMTHHYGYVNDVAEEGNNLWFATRDDGVVKYDMLIHYPYFPEGPNSNNSYRLRFFGDKLYMLPGGRWATQYTRPGEIMIYENHQWTNISNGELVEQTVVPIYDVMNVAQDPADDKHYFVTTFGTGMLEMYGDSLLQHYTPSNSPLLSAAPNTPQFYTRTDGAMYDDQGYLWLLNMGVTNGNIHVISPDGQWSSFDIRPQGSILTMHTAGEILIDRRNPQHKWIPILRYNTGVVLIQDNGTPANPSDDKVFYRREWIDQNGNLIAPEMIYCMAQDHNNTIWVGTSKGLFIIRDGVDFASSNACERIIIPRNDGSGLGDYLLDNEQINAIAIDGANRIWIGTATSGVYLMDFTESTLDADYTLETVSHFTTANSLLPSDDVVSIAIQESTGEVFFGTGAGLVSYMSDAIEPADDFSSLYAYPNPVYPHYHGNVVIKGLMADTEVRIVDPAGMLVKIIKSNGGEVVWDMTNAHGKRVASGVYTALCNTLSGNAHGAVKILIMN